MDAARIQAKALELFANDSESNQLAALDGLLGAVLNRLILVAAKDYGINAEAMREIGFELTEAISAHYEADAIDALHAEDAQAAKDAAVDAEIDRRKDVSI